MRRARKIVVEKELLIYRGSKSATNKKEKDKKKAQCHN
jgi:hypothetical protein